ncbi:PAQR family membrane homeostasis protein TrhA [Galactobacillus timonensis]|uniref:PAQR family membrane homeostasis protein TrhA n=1 Tax=Galactobacillus timonensis TaxID=2041840 RepID=UPI001FD8C4D4|nr:hemolysin III family protein [Galactobacillus timonensis]
MTVYSPEMEHGIFIVKDKWSALSHFAGFLAAIIATPILLVKGAMVPLARPELISLAIFMASMILLYGASASYHAFNLSYRANMVLKRIDHCSIFILIAGSYTPILTLFYPSRWMLALIWMVAAAGILFKLFFVTCPRWVSSVLYITMGWLCIFILPALIQSLGSKLFLLVLGGIFYTIGGFIYAAKKPIFAREAETGFGNHELFHLFVLAGSLCHYLFFLLAL